MPARRAAPRPSLAQAEHCYATGDYVSGARIARDLLAKQKNSVDAMYILGSCEAQLANYDSARRVLEKAVRINPRASKCYVPLSFAQRMLGDMDAALATLDASLARNPSHEPTIATKAVLLLALARTDEVRALLEPRIASRYEDPQLAIAWAQLCRQEKRPADALPVLEPWAARDDLAPTIRIDVLFALADALDRVGRYDDAFEVFARANALKRVRYAPREHAMATDNAIARITPEALARIAGACPDEPGEPVPIFIVGMPRSGTTLAERILGAHPLVHAAGELSLVENAARHIQESVGAPYPGILQHPALLTPSVVRRWREIYRRHIPEDARRARFMTDKLPGNAQNLALIRVLFPGSPIVHCVRNPADTGLSCYFQNFGSAIAFPYDLGNIACFYRDYARLVRHATETLAIRVLEFRYEHVVADLPAMARRLVAHCALPWDDACTAFHEQRTDARTRSADQVIQPIYASSVHRYRHYEKHIGPLLDLLADPVSFATDDGPGA